MVNLLKPLQNMEVHLCRKARHLIGKGLQVEGGVDLLLEKIEDLEVEAERGKAERAEGIAEVGLVNEGQDLEGNPDQEVGLDTGLEKTKRKTRKEIVVVIERRRRNIGIKNVIVKKKKKIK